MAASLQFGAAPLSSCCSVNRRQHARAGRLCPGHYRPHVSDSPHQPDVPGFQTHGEALFRALVEHAADLVAILDDGGLVRYASPAHERVLGRHPDTLQGRPVADLIHDDDRERASAYFAAADPSSATLLRFRHADGSWRTLSVVLSDLRHDPAVRGVVANSRDVTEQELLAAQLRQAQQMEALGQLAGGVAHDFNNVLAAIDGFARLLHDDLRSDDPRRADAEEIIRAAERGSAVARQLLAFSRRRALETEVLDLVALVRASVGAMGALLPSTVTVELPADDAPPLHVRAGHRQLDQLLYNLVTNARDAMPDGGRLVVTVHPEHGGVAPEAVLRLHDDGLGMTPEVLAHAFEPFFTTRPAGQGSGLGLATVYGLARQFGGSVSAESMPGVGTTMTVRLPLVEAHGATAQRRSTAASQLVLLVDDEEPVRRATRRMLERAGYRVVDEPDGAAALAQLSAGVMPDLILTDASMPVMGGRELAEQVATLQPGLPVLLMSGYAELMAGELPLQLVGFLEKPFSTERLRAAIEAALERRAD